VPLNEIDQRRSAASWKEITMRQSWFDENNRAAFDRHIQQMTGWQQAMADGRVDASEMEAQARRVADALRALEPTLNDEQHARVTEVLSEIAVLHAMQAWLAQSQRRLDGRYYRCPNADLARLAEAIADRFRRDDFEVNVTHQLGTWEVRTRKSDNWRIAFGMVYDVHVRLTALSDGFQARVDLGEWADKILSGALVVLGALPWLVTGSIGLYNEYQQMKDVERIIEDYVTACNAGTLSSPTSAQPEPAR
jgi:hypothetical protein